MIQRDLGPFVIGEQRPLVARAQVGVDHASGLVGRVSGVMELFSEITVSGFCRRLEHIAVNIVFPTMIDAAQAAFFVAAVEQRRSAVGALLADQTDASLSVPKGN